MGKERKNANVTEDAHELLLCLREGITCNSADFQDGGWGLGRKLCYPVELLNWAGIHEAARTEFLTS